MRDFLPAHRPALVLAPMQDITDLAFMRVIARRGAPDWFVTEYFRVHAQSRLEPHILRSINENRTGRPVFAQMIGSDPAALARNARELEKHPVAGIDLNLGCPAPIVCRKDAGGGWLRRPQELDHLLGTLRETVRGRFTVKTRVGFDDAAEFPRLLAVFQRHALDGLTLHGRTVAERYRSPVHVDCVRAAVEALPCPVIANGNAVDVETGVNYLRHSRAAGLMIGRGAIRHPWIFARLQAALDPAQPPCPPPPRHRDLLDYLFELSEEVARETPRLEPIAHVQRMKRTLAYICHGLAAGTFEYELRRVRTPEEFEQVCRLHLDHDAPLPERPPVDSNLFCGFSTLLDSRDPVETPPA